MAEPQVAVTAIRDSAAEGFVTSTLFSQGWDINFRALDFDSLISHLHAHGSREVHVLISSDCEGLTESGLKELTHLVQRVIIFQLPAGSQSNFIDAIELPGSPLELISLMRGTLRSPMIRSNLAARPRTAHVIAIGSVSGGVGCSTFTFNLAAELVALQRRVLIVDADAYSPSLAALLGERGLHSSGEVRPLSQNLSALECTQENIVLSLNLLEEALTEFDFIIMDLGLISNIPSQLSGRRWCGQAFSWMSNTADSLFLMAPSDRVGLERLKTLTSDLSTNAMRPALILIHVLRHIGKRDQKGSDKFLQIVTPVRPHKICEYPFDPRSILKAEIEESSLMESNERGIVRKMIAELAGDLAS